MLSRVLFSVNRFRVLQILFKSEVVCEAARKCERVHAAEDKPIPVEKIAVAPTDVVLDDAANDEDNGVRDGKSGQDKAKDRKP